MDEAGSKSPHLDGEEQEQAARHAPLHSVIIHEVIREQGQKELNRSFGALWWSALAAGLSMGFSYLGMALLSAGHPEVEATHQFASLGYAAGFVIVVAGRQQLFTESTLTAVLPALTNRDLETLRKLLRLWAVVLFANLIGTWLFALFLSQPDLFKPDVYKALDRIAVEALASTAWVTFLKAIVAGWLIALMVWLLPNSRQTAFFVIVFMTYLVGLGRLSHIIAGSSEVAYAVLTSKASLVQYFGGFLLPTLLGNTLGGVALVALLNHAPVKDELTGEGDATAA